MAQLKPVAEALAEICANIAPLGTEFVPLSQALGRITQDDIIAGTYHPLNDISAMDGFGVRAADTAMEKPLRIVGESAAGHPYQTPLGEGEAIRIFTGAYAPPDCDAIILQEEVTEKDGAITPPSRVESGRYIRPRGGDFSRDDVLVKQGEALTARSMALCALGLQNRITAIKKPHIAILSSGDELVTAGGIPRFGQLINSNSVFLAAALRQAGADVTDLGILPDTEGALNEALPEPAQYDLIITTGGASVGKYDYIARDIAQSKGMKLDFWKIAMRPGKPLIFGHVGDTPLIGLPGNPVSVSVCCFVFLRPLIGHLMGRRDLDIIEQTAICSVDLPANDKRQDYLRAIAEQTPNGWQITPFETQDSGQMYRLSQANALLIRPPHDAPITAGQSVQMACLPDGF